MKELIEFFKQYRICDVYFGNVIVIDYLNCHGDTHLLATIKPNGGLGDYSIETEWDIIKNKLQYFIDNNIFTKDNANKALKRTIKQSLKLFK